MSSPFSRSLHVLEADGFRRLLLVWLLAVALLGAWTGWFVCAQVALYAVTDTARLEVDRAVHPLQALTTGRVVATHLILGAKVPTGAVLVELESEAERLRLAEERARLATLAAQLEAFRKALTAEDEARRAELHTGRTALEETRARHREAEVATRTAEEEAEFYDRLQVRGLAAQIDLVRTRAEVQKRRAAADTLRLAVSRLEGEQRTRERDRLARFEQLKRDGTRLDGDRTMTAATIERLEHEIEKRRLRAPVAGELGEVAALQVGSVVQEGERLGAVIPPGELKIVADFLPAEALGRIRPGQPARLRLEGFPWTQYGTVAATVTNVASEAHNGRVRVELAVHAASALPILLQHSLPGTIEVMVERVSPATLVLRTAGQQLAAPTPRSGLGR